MSTKQSWSLLALALTIVVTIVVGCEKTPMDVLLPNQSPRVALSAGPIRDSTNIFIATFNWNAADDDGEVEYFRYAIDDTTTEADWFETDDFEITLFFTAPDSSRIDSIYVGAATVPIERYVFNGAHTFFLKAVDDDGAESKASSLSFTAETIAPETEITNPNPGGIVNLGSTFTITWGGIDPDGTEEPVAYSWRLVQVPNVVTLTDRQIEAALLAPDPENPWSPFEPRTAVRLVDLAVPGQFLFGLRAIDQAGAIEPRMRTFRSPNEPNVLLIRAEEEGGRPILKVSSSVKTSQYPTGDERKKTFQIPANTDVLFTWEADATFYGGTIAGYSYGIDLDDLELNNPGWAPESANLRQVRLRFDIPPGSQTEEHLFFVRARDDVGTTLIADVNLVVVPLRFERDVLYVDDWGRDDRGRTYPEIGPICDRVSNGGLIPDDNVVSSGDIPQDICHDAFLTRSLGEALDELGRDDWVVDRYEPLDPVDGRPLFGTVFIDSISSESWVLTGPVTLEQLARYKVVVWNTRNSANSALKTMNNEGEDNFIAVFLEAGGLVWLTGSGVFARTLYGNESVGLSPFGYDAEDFGYKFLKVESLYEGADCVNGCFRQAGEQPIYQRQNGFEAAVATRMAISEGFPDSIWVDRAPYHSNPIKGIPGCDAMVPPYGIEMNPRLRVFGGRLDTLYYYRSNWRVEVFPPGTSWMDDGAVALRYSGPGQGRLMMFGFPFFYFPEDRLVDMLASGLDWLLED